MAIPRTPVFWETGGAVEAEAEVVEEVKEDCSSEKGVGKSPTTDSGV